MNPGATAHGLDPSPTAARELAGFYRLLAALLESEPDAELLAVAATVPQLADHATRDAAAQYTQVFVLDAYPYASVYLGAEGALDPERAGFTRGVLSALGLRLEEGADADHAATLFDALATLLEREAEAGTPLDAARSCHAQRTVLDEHVLPWIPLFLAAVERADRGLYRSAARLARATLVRHAGTHLAGIGSPPVSAGPSGVSGAHGTLWPDPPSRDTEGPVTGTELAWLAVPARCGLFLSRSDLARTAADLGLAVRFGGRAFMLDGLAHAAAQRTGGRQLAEALLTLVDAQRQDLLAWSTELPTAAPLWRPWHARLDAAEHRLRGPARARSP